MFIKQASEPKCKQKLSCVLDWSMLLKFERQVSIVTLRAFRSAYSYFIATKIINEENRSNSVGLAGLVYISTNVLNMTD